MTFGPMRKLITKADMNANTALNEIYPNKFIPGLTISYIFNNI